MITKKEKDAILKAFKMVDVKKLDIDHPEKRLVKWYRFGSFSGIQIAAEVIKNWPEEKKPVKKIKVKIS